MEQNFRSAVFQLCKKCDNHPKSKEIRELIHNISFVVTKNEERIPGRPSHGDLAYISSQQNVQFLGYLITDESIDEINKQPPFHATPLDENERFIIEMAYKTLYDFIEECISEIKEKYPRAYMLINPYLKYRKPCLKTDATSIFEKDAFEECAKAFKMGKVYRKLIENDTLYVLDRLPQDHLYVLSSAIDKQFKQDYSSVSKETEDMIIKFNTTSLTLSDLVLLYSVYCYALQSALLTAVQLLFEAILGENLVVLNNDNIINIDHIGEDRVYEKYKVLCQGCFWGLGLSKIGSIVLLDCDLADNYHIKKFGTVYSETFSFAGEFGESTKFSFATVDEELNPLHIFTDYVMNSKLGQMIVKCDEYDIISNTALKKD